MYIHISVYIYIYIHIYISIYMFLNVALPGSMEDPNGSAKSIGKLYLHKSHVLGKYALFGGDGYPNSTG